jgi:hypothetical protein
MDDRAVSAATIIKSNSDAIITVDLSSDVQLSSTPLGGKFHVVCTDYEDYVSQTNHFATY